MGAVLARVREERHLAILLVEHDVDLVRSVTRKTEVAVRAALGASQRRLIQPLFIEHALLTAAGRVLGIALAHGGIAWLTRTVPPDSLPSEASVGLDARVVAFALTVSALTGILFGLMPALRASAPNLAGAMGKRGATGGVRQRRVLDALVVGEVAVAFILLCGSALLLRSLVGLINVDTGFVASNVLTMRLPVPGFPPLGGALCPPGERSASPRRTLWAGFPAARRRERP